MKKKLIIILPVLLVVAGGAYKFVLAKPKTAEPKPKVDGAGLHPPEGVPRQPRRRPLREAVGGARACRTCRSPPAATARASPPEGYGAEPQEAVIRDIVTDELTDSSDEEVISREGREKIKKHILEAIHKHTDVHVDEVLFPDVTVQ